MASKSDSIQYKYREISVDPIIVNSFANEDKINFTPFRQSDDLADLVQELSDKIRVLIDTKLTPRQKQVIYKSYYDQMTQTDIAKELGLCQPTIHKIIHGNLDYSQGGKRYGGAIKKLKKLCGTDPEIVAIMTKIDKIKQEIVL